MKPADLNELRLAFRNDVVYGPNWRTAMPCWFGAHIETPQDCDGRLEAAHWIKRQRVEKVVGDYFWNLALQRNAEGGPPFVDGLELVQFAAWDPRGAVPACERHHRRFDSHRMPPLVIPREAVPAHVEEFCADWGLESALEQKCPRQEAMTHEH